MKMLSWMRMKILSWMRMETDDESKKSILEIS